MCVEGCRSAVSVGVRPRPEKPLGGGCRGFVAEIKHRHQNDHKSTVHHLCNLVVLADFADDCPKEYAKCVEMQDAEGGEATEHKIFVNEVGDEGVYARHYGKENPPLHI